MTTHKIKKITNIKDKQLSSHTSHRLLQTPIAELQLKSFKTSAGEGSWYEVYSEPNALEMNTNEANNTNGSEKENAFLEEIKSSKNIERSPSYINGMQIEGNEPVKPKQSISFFIPLDANDEKTSFKIPKKFLRQSENSMSDKNTEYHNSKISPDEGNFDDSIVGGIYHEFVVPKLQTIHELNENEVTSELKVDMDKMACHNQTDIKEENIQSENEAVGATHDSNQLNLNKPIDPKSENLCATTDNVQLENSANIIKRAYKKYKTRQSRDEAIKVEDIEGTTNKEILDESKSQLNQVNAAVKIQKLFRIFLSRKAAQATSLKASQQTRKYTTDDIVAAIKIQKIFRDYMRRKKLAKPEWFVGSQPISLLSSASSAPAVADSLVASTDEKRALPIPEPDKNTHIELSNLDAQSNGSLELATDIGNIVNELYSTKVFETDNGSSNNLAGLTSEEVFDFVKDVGVKRSSEIEAAFKGKMRDYKK